MIQSDLYNIIIPFGRHRGRSLGFVNDTDPSYIRWLAENKAMPGNWPIAANRVLNNEPLSDLILPRQESYNLKYLNVEMSVIKKDIIQVSFGYDRELLDRFKYAVDGRKWNKDSKCWEVPAPQLPMMVELFGGPQNVQATDDVKRLWREERARRRDLDEIRIKTDSDIKEQLKPLLKLPLYDFQNVGVDFVNRADGRAMIADSMGLGKTVQSIGYAMLHNLKTLVICPKSVVIGWQREILRFTGKKATIWSSTGKIVPNKQMVGKITNWKDVSTSLHKK